MRLIGLPGTKLSKAIQKTTTAMMAASAASPINTGGLTGSFGAFGNDSSEARGNLVPGLLILLNGAPVIFSGVGAVDDVMGKCSAEAGGTEACSSSITEGGVTEIGRVDGSCDTASDGNKGAATIGLVGVNEETKT